MLFFQPHPGVRVCCELEGQTGHPQAKPGAFPSFAVRVGGRGRHPPLLRPRPGQPGLSDSLTQETAGGTAAGLLRGSWNWLTPRPQTTEEQSVKAGLPGSLLPARLPLRTDKWPFGRGGKKSCNYKSKLLLYDRVSHALSSVSQEVEEEARKEGLN